MYYEDTLQEAMIGAISNKKAATASLQGEFSAEGLTAMANSVDPRVVLANALMNGSKSFEIEKLFDKANQQNREEITEEDRKLMEKIMKGFMSEADSTNSGEKGLEQLTLEKLTDDFVKVFKLIETETTSGRGKARVVKGQLTLGI